MTFGEVGQLSSLATFGQDVTTLFAHRDIRPRQLAVHINTQLLAIFKEASGRACCPTPGAVRCRDADQFDRGWVLIAKDGKLLGIELDANRFGTHSLRRTKATLNLPTDWAICGRSNSYSATRRSRAPFVTSASRSMTPSK